MAAQFIRDETFAFKPISRSGRKTRWSIDDILHEATRDPDHPEAWRHLPDAIRMEPIPLTAMTIERRPRAKPSWPLKPGASRTARGSARRATRSCPASCPTLSGSMRSAILGRTSPK